MQISCPICQGPFKLLDDDCAQKKKKTKKRNNREKEQNKAKRNEHTFYYFSTCSSLPFSTPFKLGKNDKMKWP